MATDGPNSLANYAKSNSQQFTRNDPEKQAGPNFGHSRGRFVHVSKCRAHSAYLQRVPQLSCWRNRLSKTRM